MRAYQIPIHGIREAQAQSGGPRLTDQDSPAIGLPCESPRRRFFGAPNAMAGSGVRYKIGQDVCFPRGLHRGLFLTRGCLIDQTDTDPRCEYGEGTIRQHPFQAYRIRRQNV